MSWDYDTTFNFLELYKNHPCIWNPDHEHYKNRDRVYEAWLDIAKNVEMDCSIDDLKKKKESLMSAYRANKMKAVKAEESGSTCEVVWFAFTYMDAFLGSIYPNRPKKQTNNESKNLVAYYDADDTKSSTEYEIETLNDETGVYERTSHQEYSIQSSSKPTKRKHKDPLQLSHIKKEREQPDQTYTEEVLQEIQIGDDECVTFGTLVAQKLRKLSDDRRDVMMVKINQLFVDERQSNISK